MGVFKIPLKFNAGEYKFGELPDYKPGECLELEYDNEYQLITYSAPLYESEVRVYSVPRDRMPGGLTAVYDDSGTLDRIEFADGERVRLFYIWYKNISNSERGVLKYVKEQAERIAKELIGRKQTLARLFIEKFYDGEAVDIAVKTATAEEMKAVIDKYNGELRTADNSGNYPVANRLELDREVLGVMLMCTPGIFRSMLFYKAAEAFEERLKKRVLEKIKKTEDFRFISEEYDYERSEFMFDFLKKKDTKPPVIENGLGKFTMRCFENNPVYWYCGEAVWYGAEESILAYVSCDGKRTVRADKGFAKLSETVKNSVELDARLREYALNFAVSKFGADGKIAVPNDGEAGYVSYGEFSERIEVECVEVHENGSLSFDIWLDGMFADDSLVIGVDKDGNITGCGLQGI